MLSQTTRLDLVCGGCFTRGYPGNIGYVEVREGIPPRTHIERRPGRRWERPSLAVKVLPFNNFGTLVWSCNAGHDLRVKKERYNALVEEAVLQGGRIIIPVS